MSEPTNAVLLEKIENLTKNMDDGFKGVYERQDKTNGNVMTNTSFRLKAEANITLVKCDHFCFGYWEYFITS
jgi:hypothetical protein